MTINIETMGWGGWFLLTLITPFLLLEATPKYWPLGLPYVLAGCLPHRTDNLLLVMHDSRLLHGSIRSFHTQSAHRNLVAIYSRQKFYRTEGRESMPFLLSSSCNHYLFLKQAMFLVEILILSNTTNRWSRNVYNENRTTTLNIFEYNKSVKI